MHATRVHAADALPSRQQRAATAPCMRPARPCAGHSMGGGSAAMLTMMMREREPALAGATAVAIACPACMTLALAASCAPFVTTLVHGADIVPTFSSGSIDQLRQEVRFAD